VLQNVAVCCSVLQYVAVCFSVLPCVVVCCSVLHCVAVCCSLCGRAGLFEHSSNCSLVQSDPACCNQLSNGTLDYFKSRGSMLQCVEMYCSVLQCVVVGCKNCRWFDRVHAREFG